MAVDGTAGACCQPLRTTRSHVPSRIVTVILVIISVVWIPILQSANSGQLYVYIQSVTSYLAPPVTSIFVLAVFWRRTNEMVSQTAVR